MEPLCSFPGEIDLVFPIPQPMEIQKSPPNLWKTFISFISCSPGFCFLAFGLDSSPHWFRCDSNPFVCLLKETKIHKIQTHNKLYQRNWLYWQCEVGRFIVMTGKAYIVWYIIKSQSRYLSSKILSLSIFHPEILLWFILPPVQIFLSATEGQTLDWEMSIQ